MSNFEKPFHVPTVEDSQVIFEESIIQIRRDRLRLSPHHTYQYYSLVTKPLAVVILATTSDGRYVLTEEYRHPTGRILLSCPGGYIDGEESPLEAAKRELLEETGYQAHSVEIIGSAYPYAGVSTQKTLYVRATEASWHSPIQLESSEIIHTILKTQEELNQAIDQGLDLDGTLCTALFFDQVKRNGKL